jgi:tRNA(Ile2) C34 agmatinyltransferase TiaS
MSRVFIGIDDTDNDTSPGTGQLARWLAREIERRGARVLGITRHQFLLDDRIAYTTHNSGACVAAESTGPLSRFDFAIDLITQWSADGSDPGICVIDSERVPSEVVAWGWDATREVLEMNRARDLALAHDICLRALGGNGQGIIGALASVGLRADGNEGRFLDWPGIRELGEIVTLKELTDLGIQLDHHSPVTSGSDGFPAIADNYAPYKTMNWVRPRLVRGRPVWPVEWSEDEHAWIPVDRKKSRPLE